MGIHNKKKRAMNRTGCAQHDAPEAGQSMVEFIIAFPLVLITVLAIVQISLLAQTKLFVEYAAFNAARTAIVQPDNPDDIAEAAKLSMTPISPRVDSMGGLSVASGTFDTIAGLFGDAGTLLLRYAYAKQFTDAKLVANPAQSGDDITVHVDYLTLLTIPLVNRIIGTRGSGVLTMLSNYTGSDSGWIQTIASIIGSDYFYPLSAEATLTAEDLNQQPPSGPSQCTYSYVDNRGIKHSYTGDEVYRSGTYKNGKPQYHTDKDKTGISRIVRQECP